VVESDATADGDDARATDDISSTTEPATAEER